MKYSLIYPYYKRSQLINNLLTSLVQWYAYRFDFEVIFILDLKNNSTDKDAFFSQLEPFWDKMRIVVVNNDIYTYNSCRAYNVGVKNSTGDFIVLSSPECIHKVDILSGLDSEFNIDKNVYVVCACESIHQDGSFDQWYQHSTYNNRQLHFCTALSRQNYDTLKGFDEDYIYGIAYEDDEWLARVRKGNLKIVLRDDLLVSHLEHSRSYLSENFVAKNRQLYIKKRS